MKRGQILFRNICCHFPVLNPWELQFKTTEIIVIGAIAIIVAVIIITPPPPPHKLSKEMNSSNLDWLSCSFDPNSQRFSNFIEISNWKTKGDFGSMVWDMEFDKKGDLWFTDQVNNAIWRYFPADERFEMYRVPTNGSYPSSIAFDSQGRVWFSEIFGKKLDVIDPAKASNNTTSGIEEYQLNISEDEGFETMGPPTISNEGGKNTKNETVWFTAVNFPELGHVIKFDINKKKFEVLKLAEGVGVPVGYYRR